MGRESSGAFMATHDQQETDLHQVQPSTRFLGVAPIARRWGVSDDTVRRRFRRDDRVMKIGEKKHGKRRYVTLRIPYEVMLDHERRYMKGTS